MPKQLKTAGIPTTFSQKAVPRCVCVINGMPKGDCANGIKTLPKNLIKRSVNYLPAGSMQMHEIPRQLDQRSTCWFQ